MFGDLEKSNTHTIRMQAEVFIEGSRHGCSSSVVCTLTNVNAKTKGQGNYESPYWLLRPCDIEICKKKELSSDNEEITVNINSINIHLSAEVVHTFTEVSIRIWILKRSDILNFFIPSIANVHVPDIERGVEFSKRSHFESGRR